MKCPHCQTEIPEDAHMCGYCGKKLPEPRQQASSSPCHRAQGDLPEQVSVLATLPDKGLQKVYYGSLFLQGMGLLQYGIAFTLLVVLAILIFVMINDNELSLHDILIWSISFLSIFVLFAIGYVMRNIRIRLTRIIIRVLALFAIASSGYLLFVVFKEEGAIASTFFLVPLAIWGITWLACGIHPLFGGNSPSHEQISHVWLRRKKHLDLDTACPPPRHPSRIDKVFLLASWIWLPLAVLTTLAIMIPSYWGQRDNEELLLEESPIPEEQVVGAWNINGGFFKKEGITYVIEQYGSYYAVVYSANKNQGNDEGLVLRGHWQLGGKNGKPLLVMTMEGGPDLTSDQGRYFVLSVSEEEMVLSGFKSGGEWHWKKAATDSLEVIAAQKLYEKVSPQSGCIISNRCLRYHKENGKVVRVETEGFSYENRPEEQEESIFKNLFRLGEIKADLSADLAKLMAKKKSDAVD
ncbi:MAG: zinc ribbon domain-containing protein [Victivallales bacterium]|nr:zinc ribbon domain-containing protein [Victivallales bacterium]